MSTNIRRKYKAIHFQILSIDNDDVSVFSPHKIIYTDNLNCEFAFEIASIIQQYPNNLKRLEKMKVTKLNFILMKK